MQPKLIHVLSIRFMHVWCGWWQVSGGKLSVSLGIFCSWTTRFFYDIDDTHNTYPATCPRTHPVKHFISGICHTRSIWMASSSVVENSIKANHLTSLTRAKSFLVRTVYYTRHDLGHCDQKVKRDARTSLYCIWQRRVCYCCFEKLAKYQFLQQTYGKLDDDAYPLWSLILVDRLLNMQRPNPMQ